ncbi:hypothetical protein NPIL_407331 [Nephila pilipes]|uniref:Uncharacterized protein n=1 Tax=Nephila pilipes TaxID=299642 RepID=A0A8X6MRS8_NEPPI|nr:hypothetical protein NPIL_340931 [Nephila pilipes]GFT67834.1 hypothetical protein NPIL_407331 [Nephila pilipes]
MINLAPSNCFPIGRDLLHPTSPSPSTPERSQRVLKNYGSADTLKLSLLAHRACEVPYFWTHKAVTLSTKTASKRGAF